MSRNGHPRVPRKIRGERNRIKRLIAKRQAKRNAPWIWRTRRTLEIVSSAGASLVSEPVKHHK